jgi:hypothetical protein
MHYWLEDQLPAVEVGLLGTIREIVRDLPILELGNDDEGNPIILSCHLLARSIGSVFSLNYADGFWLHSYQHSWVYSSLGNIIDVYPVGILGGPLLVDNQHFFSPGRRLYHERNIGEAIGVSKPWFQEAVGEVTRVLYKIQKTTTY